MKNYKNILIVALLLLVASPVLAAPVSTLMRNVLPELDNTYDLGTTTLRWKNLFTQSASTTNLKISGLSGCNSLDTQADGTVICGTDDGGSSAFSWTPTTYNGVAANSTSTALWLKATSPFSLIASSTFAANASSTQLSNSGSTWLSSLTSALILTGADGLAAEYTGTTCTNQFVSALSALGVATCETVDISDDTNLTAGDALTLTGDDIDFDGGATPAGDLGGTWANPSVDNDSHDHTTLTVSGLDISDDTNLAATYPVVLTGDTLSLAFGTTTANTWAALQTFSNGINVGGTTFTALIPTTRALTIAGTAGQITSSAGAQDLSADRTWTLSLPNHVIFPGNFQATNSTTTNATTTSFFATIASSTTLFANQATSTFIGATRAFYQSGSATNTFSGGLVVSTGGIRNSVLQNCDSVDTDSNGVFICGTDGGGSGGSDFTFETTFNQLSAATSSPVWLKSAVYASSTSQFDGTATFGTSTDGTVDADIQFGGDSNAWRIGYDATDKTFAIASSTVLGTNNAFSIAKSLIATFQQGLTVLGVLDIPSAANPTVDAEGELAINTTAASSSIHYHDGTAERALYTAKPVRLTLASSTIAYYGGSAATTTINLGPALRAETWLEVACYSNAGTGGLRFGDGTNWMEYVPISTTATAVTMSTNNTFTRLEKVAVQVREETTVSVDLACTILVREDA